MQPVLVSHVVKSFGNTTAVADVSFAVERGEIIGLLERA
jgi:ABC-type Na+ transport system ATPase subunit NatA